MAEYKLSYTASEIDEKLRKVDTLSNVTKTSQLTNDSGFLTSIPSEYVTETELTAKKYLTSVPSEYVTETELTNKGYATQASVTELSNRIDNLPTGGGSNITVDSTLSSTSENPVQNKVVQAKFIEIENTIAGLGSGSGSSSSGGTFVQPDWNQNDSTAADYIKNRPFYKSAEELFSGNIELVIEPNMGIAGTAESLIATLPTEFNDDNLFSVTFNNINYNCPLVIDESMLGLVLIGNTSLYFNTLISSPDITLEDILLFAPELIELDKDTGEPFCLLLNNESTESLEFTVMGIEAGTFDLSIGYVNNIKKLPSSYIDWAGGGAPSGLPEVTEADNDKSLVVVNGKWTVASIANGDEVAY